MKFKVGNRVEHEFYGKGTVIGVNNTDMPLVEFDKPYTGLHDGFIHERNGIKGKDGHCWYTSGIKSLTSQTVVIYPKGLETIALLKEGKKVIKQAKAKCSPTDVFDFNVGAKLAFSRLMGEDAIIREVKRPAKVGEWVKIVNARYVPQTDGKDDYKNGDILQVVKYDGYNYEHTKRAYYKNARNKYADGCEYVVLENYQPEETKTLSDYTDKELINELSRRWEDKQ